MLDRRLLAYARGSVVLSLLLLAAMLVSSGACRRRTTPAALTPQQAVESFRLSEDFRVEVFAAEPEVVDPVEMVFDEDGRIYVAEMRDYPDDPPPGKPARSRIRMLEDVDGDGRVDRSWIFADQVLQVSGLLPWMGGLIVTSAPDILFMKDTNGDGRADVRQVLYTGFPKVNSEARITNLRLGIDNWIYAANNGSDGKITSPSHPEMAPVLVRGTDFRFRPAHGLSGAGQAEPASGPTQFGMTFDEWGNRFLTQNTVHIRHAVIPMQYLARAPSLGVPAVSQDISDHGRPSARMFQLTSAQAWREQRTRIRQHRHQENQTGAIEQLAGYFTAASGGTAYTGDAFPAEYRGNVFTGDVAGNLVHRDILSPDSATFAAKRARDGVEFLASTDPWMRVCNFANAPDGNLYMMDIYREFIETPESIPESIKKGMDFWSGDNLGRIYRIVPKAEPAQGRRTLRPRLSSASTSELVGLLAHPNGWHRQTAQRLLLDRRDTGAVELLIELAKSSDFPQGRLHALWTLEGLNALAGEQVLQALSDEHPALREHALRLAEPFLITSKDVAGAVLRLKDDESPRVRFQLALTLGEMRERAPLAVSRSVAVPAANQDAALSAGQPAAAPLRDAVSRNAMDALAQIAAGHAGDRWFRLAILSSVFESALPFFELLQARRFDWAQAGENSEFLAQIASLIGARGDAREVARFTAIVGAMGQPDAALRGLASGFRLGGIANLKAPGAVAALARLLNASSEAAWDVARYLDLGPIRDKARKEALSAALPLPVRARALRALRGDTAVLSRVLESVPEPELQVAAIDALADSSDAASAQAILAYWRRYAEPAREKALDALLRHQSHASLLVKALDEGAVAPTEINVAARARLLEHSDAAVAEAARRLFHPEPSHRAKVVENYREALNLAGDPGRGKRAFESQCARCHLQRRQGARVGPDLSGVNNKTREELLTSILDPSYAIESRYVNYIVTTKDGRMFDGVIASETPGSITLRDGSDAGDEIVLRRNIAEIRPSKVSLMPEEIEKALSKQDLADVIAYLRAGL